MIRILVVDDDVQILRSLRDVLQREGYEVLEATDGKKAIQLCKAQAIDVVITDILMPEKDGLETIKTLRRDYPGVGVIAMSGGGNWLEWRDCLSMAGMMGAKRILSKPLSTKEVLDAVCAVLGDS
ncbi:MAG: response regulator [Deltaproteobacteria bacterium]|nr:response regulator [Deltaproteobacteria bacterium]